MRELLTTRLSQSEIVTVKIDSPQAKHPWMQFAGMFQWANLVDVRQTYPATDFVGNFTVFNIKGNDYRLITSIVYATGRIYIKYVLTHSEYNKDKWKDDPYY